MAGRFLARWQRVAQRIEPGHELLGEDAQRVGICRRLHLRTAADDEGVGGAAEPTKPARRPATREGIAGLLCPGYAIQAIADLSHAARRGAQPFHVADLLERRRRRRRGRRRGRRDRVLVSRRVPVCRRILRHERRRDCGDHHHDSSEHPLTTPLTVEFRLRYYLKMAVPATTRILRTFEDRADALAHFFQRAGEAPRLIAYDDAIGLPLDQALAALEWTAQVGIPAADDLVHAARLGPDSAAVVVERRDGENRVFVYFGPRMDAPPADPYEGTLLYDEPGVRSYIFAQRVHAIAHFLRATQGHGAVVAMLGRRAPELRHIRRWMPVLLREPLEGGARTAQLLAGWFATSGAGFLFVPPHPDEPYSYLEVGAET